MLHSSISIGIGYWYHYYWIFVITDPMSEYWVPCLQFVLIEARGFYPKLYGSCLFVL